MDTPNTTSIQFFDQNNNSLGTFFAPAAVGSETFSFLGVSFATDVIARVRITSGNVAPSPGVLDQNGNLNDVVVMDDFLYAEPSAVPEAVNPRFILAAVCAAMIALRRRSVRQ